MKRRHFLGLLGAGAMAGAALKYWPDEGFWRSCDNGSMPGELLQHDYFYALWEGIDPNHYWDCHTHVVGLDDGDNGAWVSPKMQSVLHPFYYVRYKFYLNASCAEGNNGIDQGYIEHLLLLHSAFPKSSKFMLLAFDYHHDVQGQRVLERSPFHVPNDYVAKQVRQYPHAFEWIASVHPYREDCVEAIEQAIKQGAQAIKWIPPVMGIDPSSAKCDRFYTALIKYNLPLLTHTGHEHAVAGVESHAPGNPLLLRRALDQGVRVIMAHSAIDGNSVDIDKSKNKNVANFELFSRMMDEQPYENLLYGDISALTQINHMGEPLRVLVNRDDWHPRLLNGSDYPLPGVMPLFSLTKFVRLGYINDKQAKYLHDIRQYNPMLFDFALKRMLRVSGKRFSAAVFETRNVFQQSSIV